MKIKELYYLDNANFIYKELGQILKQDFDNDVELIDLFTTQNMEYGFSNILCFIRIDNTYFEVSRNFYYYDYNIGLSSPIYELYMDIADLTYNYFKYFIKYEINKINYSNEKNDSMVIDYNDCLYSVKLFMNKDVSFKLKKFMYSKYFYSHISKNVKEIVTEYNNNNILSKINNKQIKKGNKI